MKKIFLSTAIALSVFSMNSCERSFEEINTDTSKIKQPSVGSFLVPIQYEMGSYGYNRADDFTFDIMQVALDFPRHQSQSHPHNRTIQRPAPCRNLR